MLKDVKKKKRPRPNSTSGPPVPDLFRDLQQKLSPGHRLLCTYLSDAPHQGVKSLLNGWRSAGGQGRVLVVGDEAVLHGEEKVRHVAWPKVGEESTVSSGGAARLGFVAVRVDASTLRPAVLATIIDSIQVGGVLVLVLPHAATWHGLVGPATGPLAGPALLLEHLCVSLPSCRSWVALDSKLCPLPLSPALSQHAKHEDGEAREDDMGLEELKESLKDTMPVGPLVNLAVTLDQARSLLTFLEAAADKSVAATLSLSGPHGRGKSACIGLCLAGAIAYGYSNLFLTGPSPLAAQTVFRFVLKGFDAMDYVEGRDYDLIQGDESGVVMRVNVYREHRQTLQYLYPSDSAKLEQAEVLAIDDAGALGPQVVSRLLGPYLTMVSMSSPLGGIHASGPSTLASLHELLRQQSTSTAQQVGTAAAAEVKGSHKAKGERRVHEERWRRAAEAVSALGSSRSLSTLTLDEPVAWNRHDPLEKWALRTLGLSAETFRLKHGTPAPWDCDLFYVDRAALLSGHRLTDNLLHHILHVYGASDLARDGDVLASLASPNDHIMLLLGPQAEAQGQASGLPDILSVIHVRSGPAGQLGGEGEGLLTMGQRPLSGVEIVRVATHPEVRRMGYGLRAVHMALRYFRGDLIATVEEPQEQDQEEAPQEVSSVPKPRSALPPLLAPLDEKGLLRLSPSPSVAWVRCPMSLMRFWAKAGLGCVSLSLPPQSTTTPDPDRGIVTMLASLRPTALENEEEEEEEAIEAQACVTDFGCRALRLLSSHYSSLPSELALGLVNYYATSSSTSTSSSSSSYRGRGPLSSDELGFLFSDHDLKRLEMYSRSLVDHHLVSDLLPIVGTLFFQRRLPSVGPLPWLHAAILLGLGLQYKPVEALVNELQMPSHQILALFNKAVRRLTGAIRAVQEQSVEDEMASNAADKRNAAMLGGMSSLPLRLEDEMETSAKESLQRLKGQQEELLQSLDVMQYAVKGSLEEWEEVLRDSKSLKRGVQIKSARQATGPTTPLWEREQEEEERQGRKRGKGQGGGGKRGKAMRR